MKEEYRDTMKRVTAWWRRENEKPCLRASRRIKDPGLVDANSFWPVSDQEPDLAGLAQYFVDEAGDFECLGDSLPLVPHSFGSRGTPMTIAFYLGGRLRFDPRTIWVDPVIERWEDFDIRFNPGNYWWRKSLELLKISLEKSQGRYFCWLPDFGDCLTVFSLLRGTEQLLLDIMDNRAAVIAARDRFLKVWPEYHRACWDIYRQYLPGDCSWLMWAPGRTCACQCDFSAMLSPALFEELVVPEIIAQGKYLEYMVWHLDGPEEIRHLDILLGLPEIRAIQWVPGDGKPTAVHWLPLLKKIQAGKKALIVNAANLNEVDTLVEELAPEGLFIQY